jgi:hypothetical protein
MNRIYIKISFSFLIIALLFSCATREILESSHIPVSDRRITSDIEPSSLLYEIDLFNLNLLPPSSGVQFFRDGIVFLASTKNTGRMLSKHLSFGTVQPYYASLEDTTLGEYHIFSPTVSFFCPSDAMTFSNQYDTMYFSAPYKKDKKEKIFRAVSSKMKELYDWSIDADPLNFCKEGNIYSQPALSADGKLVVYSSDLENSVGGMDLYFSRKTASGWSDPENLGIDINSKGNEIFPYLDSNDNLFFSSNGLYGLGGYDIFVSKYENDKWAVPVNLTKHINSTDDDIAFKMDNSYGKTAFLTTRRKSGKGEMYLLKISYKGTAITNKMNLFQALYAEALAEIDSSQIKKMLAKVNSEKLEEDKLRADKIAKERLLTEKSKADSIESARIAMQKRMEAEKSIAERRKADSIENARIKANMMLAAQRKADSIEKARLAKSQPVVVYKIQFQSSVRHLNIKTIRLNGKDYPVSEYFYMGEYRYTVGELSSLDSARTLRNLCRKSGYPQAFVAAFKNNVRSNDPALFR